jgi:hypothetical protein
MFEKFAITLRFPLWSLTIKPFRPESRIIFSLAAVAEWRRRQAMPILRMGVRLVHHVCDAYYATVGFIFSKP